MSWFGDGSRGSSIPTPQALLRSVYAGRLCVAFAIYLAAALKFAVAAPLDLLVTSFVLVATVVVTSASYWYTHFLRRSPGRTFLYGQALFDIALITTVVHITGGPQSDLTPLYVPLIAVTAVLMPPASTGLITALVGIVYFADVFFGHTTPMTAQVGLQLLVFAAVAAVTAYFASRVSVMGAEREALAELSSSLAHEIKNPLASIRSSVEQLGRAKRVNADEKFLTSLVVRETDRLSRLLSEFLDFSRVRATECRPLDLRTVAAAAIRLVREHPDCPEDAVIDLTGDATPMEGDEDLLHRVVSNLVLNAVQATGKGARVEVRTGRPASHELPGGAGIESPVSLAVSDNGPGIPEGLRARLFEPFVTGRVGGTGLGLAIVQRAVDAHRGLVLVDSTPGQGTTFTVYFPAARRKEEAA